MIKIEQNQLDLLKKVELLKYNYEELSAWIIDLHSMMPCDCFYREFRIGENFVYDYLINNLPYPLILDEDDDNFNYNLTWGYICLLHKYYSDSYKYLSTAIELNNSLDTTYSLRSLIPERFNQQFLDDAKIAVELNPSIRNLFVLAKCYSKLEDEWYIETAEVKDSSYFFPKIEHYRTNKCIESGLQAIDKALSINPDFICGHFIKGVLLDKKKIYHKAIQEFNYCIEKSSNYACYYELSLAYYFNRQIELALETAQKGFNNKSETSFLWIIGFCYFDLQNYIEAIKYFNKYLEARESQTIESMLIKSKQMSFLYYLHKFKNSFGKKKIVRSIKLFENILEENRKIVKDDDLKNYYYCLIAKEKPGLDIQYKNPHYKKLSEFHRTAFLKKETTRLDYPLKDEYGPYSKLKFGKHQNESIKAILEQDPGYILWCLINLDHFIIGTYLLNDIRLKKQKNYIVALEHFLVKDSFLNRNSSFKSENLSRGGWDPHELGYSSWDEMNFHEVFEGNEGAWQHYNQ